MKENISFKKRAKLAMKLLSKQEPVTLDYARAQVLCLKIRSSNKNKEHDIKHHLKMYQPNCTNEQIENECAQLLKLIHLSFKETIHFIMTGK